jgi:hypothetical protein
MSGSNENGAQEETRAPRDPLVSAGDQLNQAPGRYRTGTGAASGGAAPATSPRGHYVYEDDVSEKIRFLRHVAEQGPLAVCTLALRHPACDRDRRKMLHGKPASYRLWIVELWGPRDAKPEEQVHLKRIVAAPRRAFTNDLIDRALCRKWVPRLAR